MRSREWSLAQRKGGVSAILLKANVSAFEVAPVSLMINGRSWPGLMSEFLSDVSPFFVIHSQRPPTFVVRFVVDAIFLLQVIFRALVLTDSYGRS